MSGYIKSVDGCRDFRYSIPHILITKSILIYFTGGLEISVKTAMRIVDTFKYSYLNSLPGHMCMPNKRYIHKNNLANLLQNSKLRASQGKKQLPPMCTQQRTTVNVGLYAYYLNVQPVTVWQLYLIFQRQNKQETICFNTKTE